ncbi:MAG: GNAT family N-acetyltransferase [Lentisphaerae bacterium]|nr:GNAT family N-acetyltransferase [Lentisphaerota bacterium]MBT4822482.1 GNAT family N-acetyltransferase [Lentisphaerota bacterium]MBT5611416.1 GNAT family N-acetyltransferase [Lentisphaerota bacterium]MBT7059644.1 GNAT family N-acetyltransferase [Lentisphaerota bacterium]MBT7846873.1 GNAT family N-acetyltransferase [Lentisphaerota bacterium]
MNALNRPYERGDRETVVALTLACFRGVSIDQNIEQLHGVIHGRDWEWRKTRALLNELDGSPSDVLVLEDQDHTLVGFVTAITDAEAGIGRILHLAVRKDMRRRGVGRRLIAAAIEHLSGNGMSHVRIETLEQNTACIDLYPKLGFEEIARQVHYIMKIPTE